MRAKVIFLSVFYLGLVNFIHAQSPDNSLSGLNEEKVNPAELRDWKAWGQGEVMALGEQTCLKEDDETKGLMIISPKSYSRNVILKFKVLALTAASVVAVVVSGSDSGESNALTISEDYDGDFSLWYDEKENYFFAFKNASHGLTPFVRKNPVPGEIIASASENKMVAGVYYDVEVGRRDNQLWLSIDDEEVFRTEDENPLSAGHLGLRIRGTAGFKGACLIKDLVIYSE